MMSDIGALEFVALKPPVSPEGPTSVTPPPACSGASRWTSHHLARSSDALRRAALRSPVPARMPVLMRAACCRPDKQAPLRRLQLEAPRRTETRCIGGW
jgi:hypothetical protein